MQTVSAILPYIQIALAVLLVTGILLQSRGAAMGSAFGGGDGSIYGERRGSEKTLFTATSVVAILFVAAALIQLALA